MTKSLGDDQESLNSKRAQSSSAQSLCVELCGKLNWRGQFRITVQFLVAFIGVALLMAIYELIKESFFKGSLTPWQSHSITIFVTASLGGFVALIVRLQAVKLVEAIELERGKAVSIVTHISDAIVIIDDQGTIETFNRSAELIFGYRAEDVIGTNVKILMPEAFAQNHDTYLHNYRSTGVANILGKRSREVEGRRASGEIFPLDLLVSEMHTGDRLRFIGVLRDITEDRIIANELLRLQQEEKRALEILRCELTVASTIQKNMLPKGNQLFAEIPQVRAYGLTHPAQEVGGDFFDAFAIDASHVIFVIGDVVGKGIPAALFMMEAMALLRSRIRKPNKLASSMMRINRQLCDNNETGMFVTLFIGELNIESGELQYINAGHFPPLLAKRGATFSPFGINNGMILGAYEQAHFEIGHAQLAEGDTLVLYTDGITEAENASLDLYTLERAIHVLNNSDGDPRILAHSLHNDVSAYIGAATQPDDITMLIIQYEPSRQNVGDFFEWSDDLNVGIPLIDDQHKTLVALINQLYDEVVLKDTDREMIDDVIEELIQYTEMHFSLEEKILADSGHQALAGHQLKHKAFKNELFSILERYGEQKSVVNAELMTLLKNWLQSHIAIEDKHVFQTLNIPSATCPVLENGQIANVS